MYSFKQHIRPQPNIITTWCFWARGRLAWWLWIFPVNNNSIFIWTSHLLGLPCIKIWSIMLLIILDPIVWIPCILQNQGSTYNMQNEISKALGKSQCSYEYPWIMNMLKMYYQIIFYGKKIWNLNLEVYIWIYIAFPLLYDVL